MNSVIQIGKTHTLQVIRKTGIGVYLNLQDAKAPDDILLPKNQVPREIEVGDAIEVFVYKNAEDVTIATVRKPMLTLDEPGPGLLEVVDMTEFGAFLNWGLEKDLLLPLSEQIGTVKQGDSCLVGLYLDEVTQRLCASMYIYDLLSTESPYNQNDSANGTVYTINDEIGVFVAVDNKYHGLILNKELYGKYSIGDNVEVRIKKVRDDGKLELSTRKPAYVAIESDSQKIMERLKLCEGNLLLNDKSSPAQIKAELNLSKGAFKRAVGRLLREGAIKITEDGITLNW